MVMVPPSNNQIVIDGLIFYCDGDPEPMLSGAVNAANITIAPIFADVGEAIDAMAEWHAILRRPGSRWQLIKISSDIERARETHRAGLIMGWQNTLPLGDKLERINVFHSLGLRVVQLTHNDANFIGDGCAEQRNSGLTNFGQAAIERMNEVGIAIDLSHCSESTAQEAAHISNKPVLITHSNAKAVDNRTRNKSDTALRAIAGTGGVIGASIHGFLNWNGDPKAPPSLENFIRHVRYIADLVGVEHVGLGTDHACVRNDADAEHILRMNRDRYPAVSSEFVKAFGNTLRSRYPKEIPNSRAFPQLLDALQKSGFTHSEMDKIAGGNFMRAFRAIWD
jgi:membrane dipeptidase